MTSAPVATKTVVTATPATVAENGTLQLSTNVTAMSGNSAPSGTVTFFDGSVSLGTVALSAASTSTVANASISVSASKLVIGANGITASYSGAANFGASLSSAITVTVTAPLIQTSANLTASPASVLQSGSTTLTVTVNASTGSISPTGTVTFTTGLRAANAFTLGSVKLTGSGGAATGVFVLRGSALAVGTNTIVASYSGDGVCGPSSASVSITVTGATVATATTVAAMPPKIAQNASTTLTAFVRPASGAAAPAGIVAFTIGNLSLGTSQLNAVAGGASASLIVAVNKLALGNNNITASYSGARGFGPSSGTVLVIVSAPAVGTSTTLTASPNNIAAGGSTQISAVVRPARGTAAPTGAVMFMLGNTQLGVVSLTTSGTTATAILTLTSTSLPQASDTITANYSGNASFAASTGSVVVTVGSAASNIAVAVSKTTDSQPGLAVKIQLQETAGAATTLTGFTINGVNLTPSLAAMLGGTAVAPHATRTNTINIQWSPLPPTLTFGFTGTDPSGRQWTRTATLATK